MKTAKIPKDAVMLHEGKTEYTTDLNAYFGDILRTTFQYYANHLCGFELGELCYSAGRQAPDVFSENYCEYSDDEIQARMVGKLNRWTSDYRESTNHIATIGRSESTISCEVTDIAPAHSGKLAAINMALHLSPGKSSASFQIYVDSEHGFYCEIIVYPEEEDIQND